MTVRIVNENFERDSFPRSFRIRASRERSSSPSVEERDLQPVDHVQRVQRHRRNDMRWISERRQRRVPGKSESFEKRNKKKKKKTHFVKISQDGSRVFFNQLSPFIFDRAILGGPCCARTSTTRRNGSSVE